jgi:dienelactone hydrolase
MSPNPSARIRCALIVPLVTVMFTGILLTSAAAAAPGPMLDYESQQRAEQIQAAARWRLAFRPSLQVLQQTVAQLRAAPGVTPEAAATADRLLASLAAPGTASTSPVPPTALAPDARRTLVHAAALLAGLPWTPARDFLSALDLQAQAPIWSGEHETVSFTLQYAAPAARARYTLDLHRAAPGTSATPMLGERVRTLASGTLAPTLPLATSVALTDVADGAYLLVARVDVEDGDTEATEIVESVHVVRDLDARHAALVAELAANTGHEEAKLLAEYPYALARAVRDGTRELVSYDFPAAMQRSSTIAAALANGRDEVRQAKGLQSRAYRFAETGELLPYQLYVPSNWSPDRQWPLVVALHGANLDETNMLGRANGQMQRLAEAHGFIVVSPLGYRLNSAYGSPRMAALASDPERLRRSEADVLAVLDLVSREYAVNPARRYLTGNSMGGGGTFWLGAQHPALWAGIAPVAFGGVTPEDTAGLAQVPMHVVCGDRDELGMLARVQDSLAVLRSAGIVPEYIEVPGGTHTGAFDTALPGIFAFFAKHARGQDGTPRR